MVCDIRLQSLFHILLLKLLPSHAGTLCTILRAQTITPTSGLQDGKIACPGSLVVFTCVTRGSAAIAWRGNYYVGDQIGFLEGHKMGSTSNSSSNPNTVATLTRNYNDTDGAPVLESTLHIVASLNSINPSVTCVHIDSQKTTSFQFSVLGK